MKSRGVYETPGGAILHFAHRQMESLTMDREVMHLRDSLIPKYAPWSTTVSGLRPSARPCRRSSRSRKRTSRERPPEALQGQHHRRRPQEPAQPLQPAHRNHGGRSDEGYNQNDATGFIRLNALRLKVAAEVGSES